jgi:hypothetical protein
VSSRLRRRLLWIAAALTVPVPFFLAQSGTVPPARVLMLAGIVCAVIAAGGGGGVVTLAAVLLLAQAALWLGVCWLGAALLARLLDRAGGRAATALTLLVIAAALLVGWHLPLYRDPFAAHVLQASLRTVYE